MVAFINFQTGGIEHQWRDGFHAYRQARFGLHHVEIHHNFLVLVQLRHIGPQNGAQFLQDAVDLPTLLLFQVKNIVVDLDDRFGFDEGRFTRSRFIVDDPANFAFMFSRYTQYPTPIPETFHRIAQPSFGAVIVDDVAEYPIQFLHFGLRQLVDAQQFWRGIGPDVAIGVDDAVDFFGQGRVKMNRTNDFV